MNEWHRDVLIFDNCPFFTRGMHEAFESLSETSISIVETLEMAIEHIRQGNAESSRLLIIGPHIDTPIGFAACREATKHKIDIIFINQHIDDLIFIGDAACMGVNRRLPISTTAEDLFTAASQVLSDKRASVAHPAFGKIQLSPRELEIVRLWADDKTGKEVAAILHISHATARNHAARILTKLNVHSRIDAIHRARHHGLI